MELTDKRRANEESILAIQIFDQKKFKKKDQGFLGVINVRIGSVMDLEAGGEGKLQIFDRQIDSLMADYKTQRCSRGISKNPMTT